MNGFSLVFLLVLAIGAATHWWLGSRQAKHVRANAATVPQPFAASIALDDHRRAAEYTLARLQIERFELGLSTLMILVWTLGGGLALMHQLWSSTDWSVLWQGVALLLSVFVVSSALELPLSLWQTFGVEARFGFNRTTPRQFVRDRLVQTGLALAIGMPLLAALLWLMAQAGDYWWLYAWALWMAFSLTLTWVYPMLIAPLFNRFEPLDDDVLKTRLEALLERCGFASNGMFVMDGSKRSNHGNAYFTGFGRNKRIVFFDTLLKGLDGSEIEAVLAHELGHFKRKHIVKHLLVSAALALAGLALLGWLSQQAWFYAGLGVDQQSPALALALFLLVTPSFAIWLTPVAAAFSRRHEFEADDFAAELVSAQHLISGLVKMYRDNASTLTPDPVYSAFYHSHPPAPVRIRHLAARAAPLTTNG